MSPGPVEVADADAAVASASPPLQQPQPPKSAANAEEPPGFDKIFHDKFMAIIDKYKDSPHTSGLTQRDRKNFIETAYFETDLIFFGNRYLTDHEVKMRAMTKIFYKVLAEEPWSEDWIRAPDVERKLSRFEMHKDSVELAAKYGITTPREAIIAARQALLEAKQAPKGKRTPRGPYDDIEIIYIPGTVSSTATNKIDRDTIYPVSVSSVANVLQTHVCREMTRPYAMAQRFVTCTDTNELIRMRQFACDVCDFAPHLLDNDNISLLVVLLILSRSEICRRFESNGIRIEGSTISHRRAECLKQKAGWRNAQERKPFDSVAIEFQTRVKNACFPAPKAPRYKKQHQLGLGGAMPTGNGKGRKGYNAPSTPAPPSDASPVNLFSASLNGLRKGSGSSGSGTAKGSRRNSGTLNVIMNHNSFNVNESLNIPTPPGGNVFIATYPGDKVGKAGKQHKLASRPSSSSSLKKKAPGSSAAEPMDVD